MTRVRNTPRMSVNKLAEYTTTAPPGRRRSLLQDQKFPSDFKVVRYRRAVAAAQRAFSRPDRETALLDAALQLESEIPNSEWDADDLRLSATALRELCSSLDSLHFDDLQVFSGPTDSHKLVVAGVEVSVRPELLLQGMWRGQTVIGAIKLHFPKTYDIGSAGLGTIAMVLHKYLEQHPFADGVVSRRHCQAVDVFRGAVECAPGSTLRRWQDVEAACEEIAVRWQSLQRRTA